MVLRGTGQRVVIALLEGLLPETANALGVGAVEGESREELRGDVPAPTGFEELARGAGALGLGLRRSAKSFDDRHTRVNPPGSRTLPAGNSSWIANGQA